MPDAHSTHLVTKGDPPDQDDVQPSSSNESLWGHLWPGLTALAALCMVGAIFLLIYYPDTLDAADYQEHAEAAYADTVELMQPDTPREHLLVITAFVCSYEPPAGNGGKGGDVTASVVREDYDRYRAQDRGNGPYWPAQIYELRTMYCEPRPATSP